MSQLSHVTKYYNPDWLSVHSLIYNKWSHIGNVENRHIMIIVEIFIMKAESTSGIDAYK